MFKVIDIRGTHGSGKSSIPHNILKAFEHKPWIGKPLTYEGNEQILGYYVPGLKLTIIGKYQTVCGGCDGIKTQDEIKARVTEAAKSSHVLLEGILVAHTFGPWNEFSQPWGDNWKFLFLDTPLGVCVERVNSRRAAAGRGQLEDTGNIVRDHGRIWNLKNKFEAAGRTCHWIGQNTSMGDTIEILGT